MSCRPSNVLLWTDSFCDSSELWGTKEGKVSPRSPNFRHKQNREPLWVDQRSIPPRLQEKLVGLEPNEGLFHRQIDSRNKVFSRASSQDRLALLNLIKSCGREKDLKKARRIHADLWSKKEVSFSKDIYVNTALISMYSKCGSIKEAQKVFDELPERDVVSWSALIASYVQQGLPDEALNWFKQMRNEGISPDSFTFTFILKACGTIRCLEIGEEIHAEVRKQGLLEKNIMLGTSLVGMYAKCGVLEKARAVLKDLPVRDAVSWSTLISGYVQCGLGNEALNCYKEMQDEGISADAITYACVLKACSSTGSRKLGETIHVEVKKKRFLEKDIVLGNVLVDMYAKLGMVGKAQDVFNELPVKDVVSWSSLITGYAQQGLGNEALNCFKQMREKGISPTPVTFACILKACGNIRFLAIGEEIHAEVKNRGLLGRDIMIRTTLVDMYAKCGMLEKAKEVFDEIVVRDVVSYNALMDGYVEHGQSDDILLCFRRMQEEGIPPDVVTFASILKSCSGTRYLRMGIEVHAKIFKQGLLEKDIVLCTALVDMYAKGGMVEKAREVFDKLPERDIVCWNALIFGYAQYGLLNEASNCLRQMNDEAITPDAVTFACIVRACGNAESLKIGERIHDEVHKRGLLEKDIVLNTTLVDMYIKCGVLKKARAVFEQLQTHDVVAWRTLISGYAQHGLSNEAFYCFRRMKDDGLSPDAIIFICILKICGSSGSLEIGEEVHGDVNKQGLLEKDVMLATTLVDMYAKCGVLVKAQEVFDAIHLQDVASWNSLMAGYAQLGQARKLLDLFYKMVSEGIEPDLLSFHVLLIACSHAGLVKEGQIMFIDMHFLYNLFPGSEHYTCMVDLFSRAGHFGEAKNLVGKVHSSDRLPLLLSLLGACQKWVEVEVAKWVFSQTLELDETCGLAYICMANIYAAAGMHAEAGKMAYLLAKTKA